MLMRLERQTFFFFFCHPQLSKTCLVYLNDSLSYFLRSVYKVIQVERLERLPMH